MHLAFPVITIHVVRPKPTFVSYSNRISTKALLPEATGYHGQQYDTSTPYVINHNSTFPITSADSVDQSVDIFVGTDQMIRDSENKLKGQHTHEMSELHAQHHAEKTKNDATESQLRHDLHALGQEKIATQHQLHANQEDIAAMQAQIDQLSHNHVAKN